MPKVRSGRGRGVARAATGLGLSALLALAVTAPLRPADAVRTPAPRHHGGPGVGPADDPLARPARGARAVDRLGDRLPEVARLNGLSRRALTTLLEEDSSAWVAADGRVFFRDPGPVEGDVAGSSEPSPSASAPLAETFTLHSRPDASRTIRLDVDGATVTGTAWNDQDGIGPWHAAWDPSRDGAAFNNAELTRVQTVWRMVSEDFAAFDVDVTTEDPGAAGLSRATSGDATYGAHVLITPSIDAWEKICNRSCGGVAYLRVFGELDHGSPYYQPAWVFTRGLGDSTKGIAEAASHEVGHQLGLEHDGKDDSSYYGGHGAWAPIMGAAYDRPISQWSRGDYPGATNSQDDLAVIATRVPPVADEAGGSIAGATPPPEGTASITSRTDVDTYALGECSGRVTANATTGEVGPDLDLQLSLLAADGSVVASANPASARVDKSHASGMGASLDVEVARGTHYLSVDGVGNGTPSTGYDGYASIGGYELSVTGCDGVWPDGAPSAPLGLEATPAPVVPAVTLTWAAPADGGSSDLTGYRVTRTGSAAPADVAVGARSHTVTGLQPGTEYTFTLGAQNASGAGPSAVATATTAVQAPGAPEAFAASWDADEEVVRLSWRPPSDEGGGAIAAYRFRVDGASAGQVSGEERAAVGSGWAPGTRAVQVRAVNSAGEGAAAARTVTVPRLPSRTTVRAPRQAGARTRPLVRVEVDGGSELARGRVRLVVRALAGPTTSLTVAQRLRGETLAFHLPRLHPGRVRVVARYRGSALLQPSAAGRTIRVVRR